MRSLMTPMMLSRGLIGRGTRRSRDKRISAVKAVVRPVFLLREHRGCHCLPTASKHKSGKAKRHPVSE